VPATSHNSGHFPALFQHAKKKQRVRVVEYWIETARECFNIGNFNSLMAIIAGLNMSPISRLKKTVSIYEQAFPIGGADNTCSGFRVFRNWENRMRARSKIASTFSVFDAYFLRDTETRETEFRWISRARDR
jgi:hypothetical protein